MSNEEDTFEKLYEKQADNQRLICKKGLYRDFVSEEDNDLIVYDGLPKDNTHLASYHIQQLVSEIGEVLDADKRWKNMRNDKYDKEAKKEELADCFIVLMNISMFSGIDAAELYEAIDKKIDAVKERIQSQS